MANQVNQNFVKEVHLSHILEDLKNGLTKWKKDDIGFGSLEKKYNLLPQEAIELFGHPKIKNVETRIPTFIIKDDLSTMRSSDIQEEKTQVVNDTPGKKFEPQQVITTKIIVEQPKKVVEAFI